MKNQVKGTILGLILLAGIVGLIVSAETQGRKQAAEERNIFDQCVNKLVEFRVPPEDVISICTRGKR
jgi:hypothetical protein